MRASHTKNESNVIADVEHMKLMLQSVTTFSDNTPPLFYFVDNDLRLNDGGAVKCFLKKDDAENYSATKGHLPMFSVDKFSGKNDAAGKYFVVASYAAFWQVYKNLNRPLYGSPLFASDHPWRKYAALCDKANASSTPLNREELDHIAYQKEQYLRQGLVVYPFAYEVVKRHVSLHLYLDLEGCKITNPSIDFEQLTSSLLTELRSFMCQMHLAPRELLMNPRLLFLDSSTGVKFSKHVIYKIPECVFQNNYICGALMRNFHKHLLQRFGPENTNPFYINPFVDAKSNTKICVLDFAVYTTNRDFRIIGSCKRKGCSLDTTQLRWLWLQGLPEQLNQQLFMDCMIQNTASHHTVYTISRVVDTINDGIPISSSLRTAQPIGGSAITIRKSNSSGHFIVTGRTNSTNSASIILPIPLQRALEKFGPKIANFLLKTSDEPFRSYFRSGKDTCKTKINFILGKDGNYKWCIETTSKYCIIRKDKSGHPFHKGRTAEFLVYATGLNSYYNTYDEKKVGGIKQNCLANSCTNGLGADKSVRSHWLGSGLPADMKRDINNLLRPFLLSELPKLAVHMIGHDAISIPTTPLFDYDPEYDADVADIQEIDRIVANNATTKKRDKEDIILADKLFDEYNKKKRLQ